VLLQIFWCLFVVLSFPIQINLLSLARSGFVLFRIRRISFVFECLIQQSDYQNDASQRADVERSVAAD
jgi:hypothetical protein